MVCSSSFQSTGVFVRLPPPSPALLQAERATGDPPSALLCFQSEWAPFRLFSGSVYPGDGDEQWTVDYILPIKMACGQQCSPVCRPLWSLDITSSEVTVQ